MIDLINKKQYNINSKSNKNRTRVAPKKLALPEPACPISINLDNTTGGILMQEIWKDIHDYEGKYQVSNLGRIKRLKNKIKRERSFDVHYFNEKILKLYFKKSGYLQSVLYKNKKRKDFLVHRLVLETFKNKSYLPINHINGIKTDNRIENLEYCTYSENQKHAYKIGLQIKGSHRKIKHNETGIIYNSIRDAGKKLNISESGICLVARGKYKNIKKFTFSYVF